VYNDARPNSTVQPTGYVAAFLKPGFVPIVVPFHNAVPISRRLSFTVGRQKA
jgi:hypothetical protein